MVQSRRLQLVLDEALYRRLAALSRECGQSMSSLIRYAVERTYEDRAAIRRKAIGEILAAPPMDLPDDPADLRRELDEAHDRVK